MKANRKLTREKCMTILYQIFLYRKNKINYDIDDVISEIIENMELEERKVIDSDYLNLIVNGVLDNINIIDENINKHMVNWDIERLGLTDQAIIRISVYELEFTDTPDLVCINEAVELAKNYSDEKVAKMINGVLDKIYHEREDKEK